MIERRPIPLVLFSGLAADATLLTAQKSAFPQLVIPPWIAPKPAESLTSYCERFAESIRPLGRCVIGGASFGGIIAMEIARFLDPLAVLLIGSIRGPHELPRRLRMFRSLRWLLPMLSAWAVRASAAVIAAVTGKRFLPHIAAIAQQYRHVDGDLLRWSIRQGLTWDETPRVRCPVYQIHGKRDRVLPVVYTKPDTIVRGAGHLISMTHANEVNSFIRAHLEQIAQQQDAPPAAQPEAY